MEQKTISLLQGGILLLNYCLGIGFLSMPYTFFYSGILAAIPTVILLFVVVWINSNYLLEVMARAQALEDLKWLEKQYESESTSDTETHAQGKVVVTPIFRITTRKFETSELCEIFFHRYIKYLNLAVLTGTILISQCSAAAIAGSAWATNIPFRYLGAIETCSDEAFLHRNLPTGGCLYAYYFCLGLFAVVVVTISLLELKEQAVIQFLFCILRFVVIAAVVFYCIVRLIQGGDACHEVLCTNTSSPINVDIQSTVVKFDIRGWVEGTPVIMFGYFIHTSIATITHPIKQKKLLHWLILVVPAAAMVSFLTLIAATLWFRAAIQEILTLNWSFQIHSGNFLPLRIFSISLILYPSVDVISGYSTGVHVVVNNIYNIITGRDTSQKPKFQYDWLFRLLLRFIVALVPILAAFGIANLVSVLKYAGIAGFTGFLLSFLLQIRSIQVCKTKFAQSHVSIPNGIIPNGISNRKNRKHTSSDNMSNHKKCYMTPYSYPVISHPTTGWVMVFVWVCLSLVLLASLFLHPDNISCQSLMDEL